MEKFNKIAAPAGQKLRQLQKMVHDIKKNDGGLMQKIKKFQNDQVALFCKTGKDTWDRITNKAPPSVPQRDYASGNMEDEDEQWTDEFDSDYEHPEGNSDSETYVVPSEDMTDCNYEPPPSAPEKLPSPFIFSAADSDYADNKQGNRQLPNLPSKPMNKQNTPLPRSSQPLPMPTQPLPKPAHRFNQPLPKPCQPSPKPAFNKPLSKPQVAPRPPVNKKPTAALKQQCDDEDEYIVPEDDNYIDPTQDPPQPAAPPLVNRAIKPGQAKTANTSSRPSIPKNDSAVYEVPESGKVPSPPLKRESLPLPRRNSPPKIEQTSDEEYETCDEHIDANRNEIQKKTPLPLPRNGKPKIPLPIKPNLPPRETSNHIEKPTVVERPRIPSVGTELPPVPSIGQKLPFPVSKPAVQKPPDLPNRHMGIPSRNSIPSTSSTIDQEAGVLHKIWYAESCDRKTAEDALYTANKDGSFLVRKSSGHDTKQPYTLVVFYNRKVYNIPIRFIESTRQYALGREKCGEEKFGSVAEMIENHQRNSLVLIDSQNNTKDSTKLKQAVKVF
ncbi:B-cell linker protein isoform X3 [Bombina bombina]|uniref:B-cell linker protein isoform X3 n=1 Tax=Bombina bombina TaxID=8345 RepID=UPI00235AC06C|nr:B-cell linker protein isoform X3 [Bombina bombina]